MKTTGDLTVRNETLSDAELFHYTHAGKPSERLMARELLAHRRASQAAPAPSDGLREVTRHLDQIVEQLDVNPSYFSGSDKETLEILQGHIRDSVTAIRAALSAPAQEGGE